MSCPPQRTCAYCGEAREIDGGEGGELCPMCEYGLPAHPWADFEEHWDEEVDDGD